MTPAVKTEVFAGLTTFLTMAYIMFVNPSILATDFAGQPTGMDFGAIVLATCLAAAFTSILMGLYANYPIALAPGMGENFFFVSVVMALSAKGITNSWQVALGIVFISGILFLLLSLAGLRTAIINWVSPSMRNGIAAGIGFFIALIGLKASTLIVANPGTMVGLNSQWMTQDVIVFAVGLLVTSALWIRKVPGAVLWGIVAATVTALLFGKVHFQGIFGFPQIKQSAIFAMDLHTAMQMICWPFIAVFLFMNVFDSIGTLFGVAETAGFIKDNKLPRVEKVLKVDAIGTVAGACLGTSTVVSYIESATGVAAGGRTGLTAVVTGVLFLVSLCFFPLISAIAQYPPITAAALVMVGSLMLQNVRKIDWDDASEYIPAFIVMAAIPFTYSIADGLAIGFIAYPLMKLAKKTGKA